MSDLSEAVYLFIYFPPFRRVPPDFGSIYVSWLMVSRVRATSIRPILFLLVPGGAQTTALKSDHDPRV